MRKIFNIRKILFIFCSGASYFIAIALIFHLYNNNTAISTPKPASIDVFKDVIMHKLSVKSTNYHLFEGSTIIPQAEASDELPIDAAAYILTDLDTGEVIASKNKDKVLPIASLTKVMTAIVALDLADPAEKFEVTENAARKDPTKIGAKVHEKLTLSELLQASLLTSANDATQVIADGIDKKYGEKVFVNAMNEKADFLRLSNSSFANPQGFDDKKNYSTVSDLTILAHYAMENYPLISDIVKKDVGLLEANSDHHIFDLPNWNGLIGVYPSTIGLKIGNTGDAGKTTIVISNRGEKKLVAIVLGAPTIEKRDLGAASLLDYGYAEKLGLAPVGITEEQLREKYATWYND